MTDLPGPIAEIANSLGIEVAPGLMDVILE